MVAPEAAGRPTRTKSPTVDQVRAFCAVAEAGSYGGAAELLGVGGRLPLIRRVNRLTATLDRGPLVTSTARGQIALTPAGHEIYSAARRLADAAAALVDPRPRIRFSTYPSIAARLAEVAHELIARHGLLELYDITDRNRREEGIGLLERTASGELDIVIAPAGHDVPGLRGHLIYEWTMRVALPRLQEGHPLQRKQVATPVDLREFRFVAAPPGHRSRRLLESAFAIDRVRLDVAIASTDPLALRQIAENSLDLVAAVPDDSFGPPDDTIGPQLATSDGSRIGGAYAVYAREPESNAVDGVPSARDAEIERLVATMRSRFQAVRLR